MRKTNSIKNFLSVSIPYIIIGLLGFIRVRFFLNNLGEEVSSLNQLYNNLLAYLALAEGGVGLFVVQKYYKCFVDDDKEKIKTIFNASKKYFQYVALFIFLASIVLSLFLNFVTNNNLSLSFMQITFIIFSVRYAIEYFFYAPRFVIQADQKLYKINYFLNSIRILEIVCELLCLLFTDNYILILIPGLIIRLIGYPLINIFIYKCYPYLKENYKKDSKILKGFNHIMSQKIAGLVYENTDVIIVSSFLSPMLVIVYTSYNYISKYLNDFATMFSASTISSLGNALYKEELDKSYEIFSKLNILFVFVASFFSICFYLLSLSFINLWVGSKYVVNSYTLFLFSLVLYINVIKKPVSNLKDNLGYFKETKLIILLEAFLNVIISIILVKKYQINGILLGTIISSLITTYWFLPFYVYKRFFKKNVFIYFYQTIIGFIILICLLFVPNFINAFSFITWVWKSIIIALIVGVLLFVIYYIFYRPFRNSFKDLTGMLRRKNEKNI